PLTTYGHGIFRRNQSARRSGCAWRQDRYRPNPGPANQPSLLLDNEHASAVARFLRDDPALRLDFCSNVTGVDWRDRTVKKTVKVKKIVNGEEKEVDETTEEKIPGYLEAVYHLYSMTQKHGPVVIRMRTADR